MIPMDRLVALAVGELDDAERDAIDAHLLACGACTATVERLLDLEDALRELVRDGQVAVPVSAGLERQLREAGLVSRTYRLAPGEVLPCSVGADDLYALTVLQADLRAVERVDVVRTTAAGSTRMIDVPFVADDGVVRFVSRSDRLRELPTCRIELEVVAVDAGGERRIGAYSLEHDATPR
jgi:anti-sigma factor RsiW